MPATAPLAASYARWRTSPLGAITERVEKRVVFEMAGPLRGRRVLDVGTGDGTYAIEAARHAATVVGLDSDPVMLAAARSRVQSANVALTLREGHAEALPFDDGAFDVVLAVTVLCFVPDATAVVREMARVLVPGGHLVLGELNRFSVWAAQRRMRGWLGSNMWRRARFWSLADLKRLAREAELQVNDVRGSVFFPPSDVAARFMAPFEPTLTRLRAPGAAFLALAAHKAALPP
ncbi:class I SAM-dependent methyltransferase [Myxococcus xanthus]|uniref:class I SAM-dependent methyltransferase n=1 Tax=Myxococcus xanthus TaxID=34 RepID=UPI001129F66F|nr:class I SAM-dependent methyltransferase [Myxococcus xanthus]